MHSINQSKNKQIKGRRILTVEDLRKSRTKELPGFLVNCKTRSPQNKLSTKKSHETLNSEGDNRKKAQHHRNLHVQLEYYNQQCIGEPFNHGGGQDFSAQHFKPSGNNSATKPKKGSFGKKTLSRNDLSVKAPKLKFIEPKGVITFEGKVLKVPPKKQDQWLHKNYTSVSNSQFTAADRQKTHRFKLKTNVKSKSKSKSRKKQISAGKQAKMFDKMNLRKTMGSQQREIIRKILLNDDTQVSPLRQNYERNEFFDFYQIHFLVDQELNERRDPICIDPAFQQIRSDCIRLISRLSGTLRMRRESFYLSVSIFDRSLDCNISVTNRNYRLLAVVSLALSLKLEEAQLGVEFVHVLGTINSNRKNNSMKSTMSKSRSRRKKGEVDHISDHGGRIKMDLIAEVLGQEKCSKISHSQFMQLELDVAMKLQFKLWRGRIIYWADLLTCLWDQYIFNQETDQIFLFRDPKNLSNLAYLYQILQMAHLSVRVHLYQPIYIILSIMYLLLRISLEKEENGFQFYRATLSKSTGVLFVDQAGVNQLFWNYLQKLKVDMGDILGCCQFVSEFLLPHRMDKGVLGQPYGDFEHTVMTHTFSPDLYDQMWK